MEGDQMRLEWLKDIVSIAETGSFSEAAKRRNLTQSAFSRRIQQIEDYLGIELFDRSKKPIQLRPTTAEHLDQMARVIGSMHQLADDLRRGDRMAGNRLAIASQHALSVSVTPQILKRVQNLGLDVRFRLTSANLDECFVLLLSRRVDLAITFQVEQDPSRLREEFIETMVIGTDRLVPVVGSAYLDRITRNLSSRALPVITYPGDVFFGEVMNRHLLPGIEEGLLLESRAECALTLAVLELSIEGLGVAWVPLSIAKPRIAAGTVTLLDGRLPSVDLLILASRLTGTHSPTETLVWEGTVHPPLGDQG
jgi:LysR family transcriptional regulator, hypochlorite-specific transcription factor HypT